MTDLSKVEKSMTKVLTDNKDEINQSVSSGSVQAVYSTVEKLFKENNINTPASNRLLQNIAKDRSATAAMYTVYNSILAGMNEAVIR